MRSTMRWAWAFSFGSTAMFNARRRCDHVNSRCIRRLTSMCSLPLFYSDHCRFPLPPKHRFPMQKYELVRRQLQQDELLANVTFTAAPLATRVELETAHDASYVTRFLNGTLSEKEIRQIGFPWSSAGVRRALASTGGTMAAMRCVLNGARMAGQLAGGTHHARRDRGSGFCVFNDVAVASLEAVRHGQRVVVLDFDVHQGDGTADVLRGERNVFTVSLHAENNFPFDKVESDVDIGFADGTGDDEYLAVVEQVVPDVLDGFAPDVAVLQMGVDALAVDSLGRLSMTRGGLWRRNRFVYEQLLRRGVRAVLTMGGGYGAPMAASVAAHCDVYSLAARLLTHRGRVHGAHTRAAHL